MKIKKSAGTITGRNVISPKVKVKRVNDNWFCLTQKGLYPEDKKDQISLTREQAQELSIALMEVIEND